MWKLQTCHCTNGSTQIRGYNFRKLFVPVIGACKVQYNMDNADLCNIVG